MENRDTIEKHRPASSAVSTPARACKQFAFDALYVDKLIAGDPQTESHFVDYFSPLLHAKLRFHLRSWQDVQDFQQEVLLRVLRSLREGEGLRHPERLGAFVSSVCSNILFEHFRHKSRHVQFEEDAPEPRDPKTDLERDMVEEETRRRVRQMIDELAPRDRSILRAAVLEERQPEALCREFGVSKGHLRVLLHRARERFRRLTCAREAISTDC
jgi:RNA polymerase sigma-70 factor (ECF subfamily)